jgi:hypothetical protein
VFIDEELESIEDKAVDDDTKRVWLTNTLQSHEEMNNAICQAITTELTHSGINGTVSTVPWDNSYIWFYPLQNLLTMLHPSLRSNNVKPMLPNSSRGVEVMGNGKQKNGGRNGGGQNDQNGGRGGGHNNGHNGGNKPPIQYTKYTGPQMSMAAPMIFTSEDWKNKLTQAQRDKLKELKIGAKSQTKSINHNSTPTSTYNGNVTQSQPSPPATPPVPGNNLRQMLSNSHSRAPTQINTVHLTEYCVDIQSSGALINGGANGGLGGSDVRVMWETYSTGYIAGIGGNSILTYPSVRLVQSSRLIKALSLVSLTNMLTLAKDRPSTQSTSSSTLVSLLMILRVNLPMVNNG